MQVKRPAATIYVFAMMILSLCRTRRQAKLVQGALMGIAMGLLQLPAFAMSLDTAGSLGEGLGGCLNGIEDSILPFAS